MIFGPSFDYDLNRQIELIFGGGIGFASHNDEIKSVGNSTGFSYRKMKLTLLLRSKQALITLLI